MARTTRHRRRLLPYNASRSAGNKHGTSLNGKSSHRLKPVSPGSASQTPAGGSGGGAGRRRDHERKGQAPPRFATSRQRLLFLQQRSPHHPTSGPSQQWQEFFEIAANATSKHNSASQPWYHLARNPCWPRKNCCRAFASTCSAISFRMGTNP